MLLGCGDSESCWIYVKSLLDSMKRRQSASHGGRELPEVRRAAVELVGQEAAEQSVLWAVVVRGCAAQQAQRQRAVGEQDGLMRVVGHVEGLDAVEAHRVVAL